MNMTEQQENIAHLRMCVSAISLWLAVLADYCDEDEMTNLEGHLAEISRVLNRLDFQSAQPLH